MASLGPQASNIQIESQLSMCNESGSSMGAETLKASLGLGLLASLIICADAGKVGGRRSHDSSDVGGGCVGAFRVTFSAGLCIIVLHVFRLSEAIGKLLSLPWAILLK